MRVRTRNGFWEFVRFAAVAGLFCGGLLAGHLHRSGITDTVMWQSMAAGGALFFVLFLWPAARNLYEVWRASLRTYYSPSRARSLAAPAHASLSPSGEQRVLPASIP